MTPAEACLKLVEELPRSLVESLIAQLRGGYTPSMPSPGYQAKADEFVRRWPAARSELAAMFDVALTARRSAPTTELVWTGPPTAGVPGRRTEQVLFDLIQCAERRLTVMSFGIFQVARLVVGLEEALVRGVGIRIVLGDREGIGDEEIDRQRRQLVPWWPHRP
jgi:phosphatidylserine/phosphatidylglycerophosphate/cardiolipin synthase-like enzyme